MIMCVLLCYPVSIHMSQLLSTGRPISSFYQLLVNAKTKTSYLFTFRETAKTCERVGKAY